MNELKWVTALAIDIFSSANPKANATEYATHY